MQLVLNLVKFIHYELPSIIPCADQLAFVVVVIVDVFLVDIWMISPKSLLLIDCFWIIVSIASIVTIILSVVFSLVFTYLVIAHALLLLSERVGSFIPAVG